MIDRAILRRVHDLQHRRKRGPEGLPYDELDDQEREQHDASAERAIASYHRLTARELPIR